MLPALLVLLLLAQATESQQQQQAYNNLPEYAASSQIPEYGSPSISGIILFYFFYPFLRKAFVKIERDDGRLRGEDLIRLLTVRPGEALLIQTSSPGVFRPRDQ